MAATHAGAAVWLFLGAMQCLRHLTTPDVRLRCIDAGGPATDIAETGEP